MEFGGESEEEENKSSSRQLPHGVKTQTSRKVSRKKFLDERFRPQDYLVRSGSYMVAELPCSQSSNATDPVS